MCAGTATRETRALRRASEITAASLRGPIAARYNLARFG